MKESCKHIGNMLALVLIGIIKVPYPYWHDGVNTCLEPMFLAG